MSGETGFGTAEPVEAPHHDAVDVAPPGRGPELIERRAARRRAGHAAVHELAGDHPAARRGVAPELDELEIRILVDRGDAGVEGDAHESGVYRPRI